MPGQEQLLAVRIPHLHDAVQRGGAAAGDGLGGVRMVLRGRAGPVEPTAAAAGFRQITGVARHKFSDRRCCFHVRLALPQGLYRMLLKWSMDRCGPSSGVIDGPRADPLPPVVSE